MKDGTRLHVTYHQKAFYIDLVSAFNYQLYVKGKTLKMGSQRAVHSDVIPCR